EAVQKVLQRERDAESKEEIIEDVHRSVGPEQGIRELQSVDEDKRREHAHQYGEKQHFLQPEFAPAKRRDSEKHQQRRYESQPLQRKPEDHDGKRDHEERSPPPLSLNRFAGDDAADHHVKAEQAEDAHQHRREIPRAHALYPDHRIVARKINRERADDQEQEPGEKILVIVQASFYDLPPSW